MSLLGGCLCSTFKLGIGICLSITFQTNGHEGPFWSCICTPFACCLWCQNGSQLQGGTRNIRYQYHWYPLHNINEQLGDGIFPMKDVAIKKLNILKMFIEHVAIHNTGAPHKLGILNWRRIMLVQYLVPQNTTKHLNNVCSNLHILYNSNTPQYHLCTLGHYIGSSNVITCHVLKFN